MLKYFVMSGLLLLVPAAMTVAADPDKESKPAGLTLQSADPAKPAQADEPKSKKGADVKNSDAPAESGKNPKEKLASDKSASDKPIDKSKLIDKSKPIDKSQKPGKERPGKDQPGKEQKAADQKRQSGKPNPKLSDKERETAALAFAGSHHPELVSLIEKLKDTNSGEYQRAIRDLARTSERLTQIQEKEPTRYELELNAWKVASRVRLLAARLTMAREPALEQELRDALGQQIDVRLQLLQLDQEELNARLKKLDSTIETMRTSRDQQIKENFDSVLRNAAAKTKPVNPNKKIAEQSRQKPKGATAQVDSGKEKPPKVLDGAKPLPVENKTSIEPAVTLPKQQ